jgi:hypothetical protein
MRYLSRASSPFPPPAPPPSARRALAAAPCATCRSLDPCPTWLSARRACVTRAGRAPPPEKLTCQRRALWSGTSVCASARLGHASPELDPRASHRRPRTMPFCTSCGHELPSVDYVLRFCPRCGEILPQPVEGKAPVTARWPLAAAQSGAAPSAKPAPAPPAAQRTAAPLVTQPAASLRPPAPAGPPPGAADRAGLRGRPAHHRERSRSLGRKPMPPDHPLKTPAPDPEQRPPPPPVRAFFSPAAPATRAPQPAPAPARAGPVRADPSLLAPGGLFSAAPSAAGLRSVSQPPLPSSPPPRPPSGPSAPVVPAARQASPALAPSGLTTGAAGARVRKISRDDSALTSVGCARRRPHARSFPEPCRGAGGSLLCSAAAIGRSAAYVISR